jgi:hypothetical protein
VKRARAAAKATRRQKDNTGFALLKAVDEWVESCGGKVLVAGGISIETWPGDSELTFYVRVKCTGRKPVPQKPEATK